MASFQTHFLIPSTNPLRNHKHQHPRNHSFLLTWRVLLFLFHLPYLTNAQSFDLEYEIDEEVPVSHVVGSIANDSEIDRLLSSTDFQSLSYRLLHYPDTNAYNLFTISTNTGVLRTAKSIDREILCRFKTRCILHLHVAAQTASGQQFYTFSVKIYVKDINDNPPVFHLTSASVEINEDASIETSLPIPSATDNDIMNNTLQSYRLVTDSDFFGLKVSRNLDGTLVPQLYLKAELDREKQDSYLLTVIALDGGSPRKTGELTINVTVKDANDNAPIFSQQTYDLVIDEVTPVNSRIMTLKAFDPDIGDNGHVLYRLGIRQFQESLELFKVTPETGFIITERELTSFQGKSMRLVVEAVDRGRKPLIAQAEVNIHIRDSVNNVPKIRMTTTNSNLIFHISEEAKPGFVVTHFVVEDNDSGENGVVRCYLNNGVFAIQGLKAKEFKVSLSQHVDREITPFYDVSVTCEDGGQPSLSTHVRFAVILTDSNDKTPKFTQREYRAHISENAKNVAVLTVRAEDEDQGNNAKVTYSLGNVTSFVSSNIYVNPVTGEIKTKKGLDRELVPRLEFVVVATDSGLKPLSCTASVIIDVDDQNDNTPSVPPGYYLSIMENLPAGSIVGKIRAIDPDLGPAGRVSYQLFEEIGRPRLFNLTVNGLVRALRTFDREANDTYQINVVASDYGRNSRSNALQIRIKISDDNDHAPKFLFPRRGNKTAYVNVDVKANTTVTRIVATDADFGENATIQYSFEVGRQNLFRVDPRSGRVFTRRNVKHDDKGSYNIRVYIRDMGPEPITNYSDLVMIVTQGNGTGTAAASNVYRKSHIIIVAILIGITIIIAVLVFIVVFRFITKDRHRNNMRHAKYTGGLPMAVKSRSTSPHDDNSSEEGPWRRYDEAKRQPSTGSGGVQAVRQTDVTYDTNDDILMFKMRLADQYRELEPEDKMSPSGTLSRDGADSNRTSVLSDVDGGTDVSSNKGSRLATFQVKATPIHGSHNLDKNGGGGVTKIPEEVLSSCSRDLGGTDSGRGTSEDGSQDDSGYPTSPGHVTVRSGTTPRLQGNPGGNYSKSFTGSAFDRPPLLMTFQGSHNNSGSGSNSSGTDSPSSTITNSTTLPSRRDFSYIVNKDRKGSLGDHENNEISVHKINPSNRPGDNLNDSNETFLKQKINNPGRLNMNTTGTHPATNTTNSAPKSTDKMLKDFDKSINSIKEQINSFLRPKDGSNSPKPILKETRLCSEPFASTKLYSNIKPSINSSFTPRGVQETGIPSASIYATQNGGNSAYNRSNPKPLILGRDGSSGDSGNFEHSSNLSSPTYGSTSRDIANNFNTPTNMTSTPSTSITNRLNSCPQLYKDSPSKVSLHSLSSQPPISTSNPINKNRSRSFQNRESPLTLLPRSPLDLMNESLETQDDGNTTTTSGSYTIDHMDDLNLDMPSTDVYV